MRLGLQARLGSNDRCPCHQRSRSILVTNDAAGFNDIPSLSMENWVV
jgi:hypothetical protein